MKLIYCTLILMLNIASCSRQNTISDVAIRNAQIPVFIEMPRNPLVFDNIGPQLYQAVHNHFLRIGYILVDSSHNGYTVRMKTKELEPTTKLVSPDIVLMHSIIRLEVECVLYDFKQRIVAQKTFFFSSLISKSKNPILNSDFVDFEYTQLFEKAAPIIERFFRKFLLQAFTP